MRVSDLMPQGDKRRILYWENYFFEIHAIERDMVIYSRFRTGDDGIYRGVMLSVSVYRFLRRKNRLFDNRMTWHQAVAFINTTENGNR